MLAMSAHLPPLGLSGSNNNNTSNMSLPRTPTNGVESLMLKYQR